MLDLNRIRTEPDVVKAGLARKGVPPSEVDEVLALDKRRRDAIVRAETLKSRRNEVSKQIGALKKQGADTSAAAQAEMRLAGRRSPPSTCFRSRPRRSCGTVC